MTTVGQVNGLALTDQEFISQSYILTSSPETNLTLSQSKPGRLYLFLLLFPPISEVHSPSLSIPQRADRESRGLYVSPLAGCLDHLQHARGSGNASQLGSIDIAPCVEVRGSTNCATLKGSVILFAHQGARVDLFEGLESGAGDPPAEWAWDPTIVRIS